MATFPTWISKRNNSAMQALSPRQVANKAHSLAIKKLDRDDKRKKPQYSIRERLLLSKTMIKAEEVLNKKPTMYRSAVSFDDDDIMPPFKRQQSESIKKNAAVCTTTKQKIIDTPSVKESDNNNDSTLPSLEQMAAVSLVVVTVVASLKNSINDHPQAPSLSSQDFCRAVMIPSHSSLTTII